MGRSHIDHWAKVVDHYSGAEEFIAYLNSRGVFLDFAHVPKDAPVSLDLRTLLDQCFEVDRKGLDDDRVALLDDFRKQHHIEDAKSG